MSANFSTGPTPGGNGGSSQGCVGLGLRLGCGTEGAQEPEEQRCNAHDHNMAHAHDLLPPQSLIFADLIYE